MSRQYVNQLQDQQEVDEVYLASGKQLRPNRAGTLYLQVELTDRTGTLTARLWNAGEAVYKSFGNGEYINVRGTAQLFQGAMQIIAKKITPVDGSSVDPDDFAQVVSGDIDRLVSRIREIVRSMKNPHLQMLADCFLADDAFMARFTQAPAGVKHHHAYRGGLLEHTVTVMDIAQKIAPLYPKVDRDLLLAGAMLHDIGKTDELGYVGEMEYTDAGQLLGHVMLAVLMLDQKVREAADAFGEPFPEETLLRLRHMIVSHHGQYEFGSPRLPMTLEAIMLHFLDSLDSKVNAFESLIDTDPNTDSSWTHYHASLGRKLFKGGPAAEAS